MSEKAKPTPELLRKLLQYETETGRLFWRTAPVECFTDAGYPAARRCKTWNGKYAGKEALCHRDKPGSYAYGDVFGQKVYAHRAILAIMNGEWPEGDVDHISGDRTDNRLVNLRAVSRGVNAMNRTIGRHNNSGVLGVYWDAARKKWAAEINAHGERAHLGRFDTLEEAAAARAESEAKLGFHPNHGRQPLTLTR